MQKAFALTAMSFAGVLIPQSSHATEVTEPDDDHDRQTVPVRKSDHVSPLQQRLRRELDTSIQHRLGEQSDALVEFFETATVESMRDYLSAKQLLQYAARYANDPDIIAFLIESGFDPNEAFGSTSLSDNPQLHDLREGPLHDAAAYNPNPSIVEALIRGGADVHARGGLRLETPLHDAAANNNAAVVSALIEHGASVHAVNGYINPSDFRQANINGNTPLHRAAFSDEPGVIDTLVDAGAKPGVMNASGMTPLHFAVLGERAASISALVRLGADPRAVVSLIEQDDEMHDCTGCNPIHLLVDSISGTEFDSEQKKRLATLLKVLVDSGSNINAVVGHVGMYAGYTPLRLAIENEETDAAVVAMLMDFGARVDGGSLLAVFSETFQYSGKYAGANYRRSVGSVRNRSILDLLIASGIDLNHPRDDCGRTALHRAVSFAFWEDGAGLQRAIEALVQAGADVNTQTYALDDEVAEGLGCDDSDLCLDAWCRWGSTPLHEAARHDGDDESGYAIAKLLLDAGARRDVRDRVGRTAQDVANSERMKRLLATDRLEQERAVEH